MNKFPGFLIKVAGSDTDILKDCPKSEHIKHAEYGLLVLVPAILAFFSMRYGISLLTSNKVICVLAGIAWGLIILGFDRFIISSFRKKESVKSDLCSPTFIARLTLSVFVGSIIAHPLVLFIFNPSITQRINFEIDQFYSSKIQLLKSEQKALKEEIKNKEEERNKSHEILT